MIVALGGCAGVKDVDHKWCPPQEQAVPVSKEKVEISADALFKFDRFAANDLLPQGKETLDKLARNMQRVISQFSPLMSQGTPIDWVQNNTIINWV